MMLRSTAGRRAVATAATAVSLALALAACSGTTKDSVGKGSAKSGRTAEADPNAPLKKGLKLAFLPKQINNPYEKIVDDAGIAA
ncbi:rhamnose ABC transporter substrate-binding protein, partial [Streptomyces mirabilis]